MKDLLIKMASIANELDLKGFEKEANQVTVDMLKLAQASQAAKLFPGVIVQGILYYLDDMMKLRKIYPNEAPRVLGRSPSAFRKDPDNNLFNERAIFEYLSNPTIDPDVPNYQQLKLREMANQKPTKAEAEQMAWILKNAAENNMTSDALMKKLQSGKTAQSEKFVNNLAAYLRSRNVFGDEVISPLTVQSFSEYYKIFNPMKGRQEKPKTTVKPGESVVQSIQYSAVLPNNVQIMRQDPDSWMKKIMNGELDGINPNQIKFYNEDGKLAENDISVKTFKQMLRERQQKK